MDKNIELIVSLTSLSRWIESGSNDGASPFALTMPTVSEKSGRGGGVSGDKTSTDISPARGVGSRRRTSTVDTIPQTPGPHASLHDGSLADSKKYDLLEKQRKCILFDLFLVGQKEILLQPSSLIAEIYSWKSLSMGQPTLRLHTTTTKAAFLTLPPGYINEILIS